MVIEEKFTQHSHDRWQLTTYRWSSGPAAPRAIILLSHGMGEHALRYRSSLASLIDSGFDVYAIDHRGHGASVVSPSHLGDFGPGGFAAVVSDLADLARFAKEAHPNTPIVLLGHSMGSTAVQLFLLRYPDLVHAVALSGSAAVDHLAKAMQDPLFLTKLNSDFEPARTPFDWLSRSDVEVDKYIEDPLCGFALRPESFASWFAFGPELADGQALAKLPKQLPVYIFSGELDPLNHLINGLRPVIDRYRAAGLKLTVDIFPGGRHEILNEQNRAEVVQKLADWMMEVLDSRQELRR
jgi:alpha-beta hydrolase superfamily lysophospholipase